MNRLENTAEKQKCSKISIISLMFGILGITVIFIRVFFYRPWWSEYVGRNVSFLAGIIGLILGIAAISKISRKILNVTMIFFAASLVSFILSLFMLRYTNKAEESFYNSFSPLLLILSIIILLLLITIPIVFKQYLSLEKKSKRGIVANSGIAIGALLMLFWWIETCGPVQTALSMRCGINLKRIGEAISIYSDDNHGQYPGPDQWCGLLLKSEHVKKDDFLCPEVKFRWKRQFLPLPIPVNRKSYYAMNPNCEPNSPPDTVLLFESKGGWNKSGGPELLTTQNHLGLCHVLFNDGSVGRIKKEEIPNLKWE